MDFKNSIIAIVIAVIGGISGYFQGTASAKEASASAVQSKLTELEIKNAVQDTEVRSLVKSVDEIKADVKEIKNLFYEDRGWNKPAVKAPIIKDNNDPTIGL